MNKSKTMGEKDFMNADFRQRKSGQHAIMIPDDRQSEINRTSYSQRSEEKVPVGHKSGLTTAATSRS